MVVGVCVENGTELGGSADGGSAGSSGVLGRRELRPPAPLPHRTPLPPWHLPGPS